MLNEDLQYQFQMQLYNELQQHTIGSTQWSMD